MTYRKRGMSPKLWAAGKEGQSVKRVVAGKVEEKNNSLIFIY